MDINFQGVLVVFAAVVDDDGIVALHERAAQGARADVIVYVASLVSDHINDLTLEIGRRFTGGSRLDQAPQVRVLRADDGEHISRECSEGARSDRVLVVVLREEDREIVRERLLDVLLVALDELDLLETPRGCARDIGVVRDFIVEWLAVDEDEGGEVFGVQADAGLDELPGGLIVVPERIVELVDDDDGVLGRKLAPVFYQGSFQDVGHEVLFFRGRILGDFQLPCDSFPGVAEPAVREYYARATVRQALNHRRLARARNGLDDSDPRDRAGTPFCSVVALEHVPQLRRHHDALRQIVLGQSLRLARGLGVLDAF
mmetsp:Transcript_13516/g.44031  ORF Transcript_13516/g.44031 Transcript_13516/m.44031 type:complete len:316 (+) Transcript_13516:430-1377(+)